MATFLTLDTCTTTMASMHLEVSLFGRALHLFLRVLATVEARVATVVQHCASTSMVPVWDGSLKRGHSISPTTHPAHAAHLANDLRPLCLIGLARLFSPTQTSLNFLPLWGPRSPSSSQVQGSLRMRHSLSTTGISPKSCSRLRKSLGSRFGVLT